MENSIFHHIYVNIMVIKILQICPPFVSMASHYIPCQKQINQAFQ